MAHVNSPKYLKEIVLIARYSVPRFTLGAIWGTVPGTVPGVVPKVTQEVVLGVTRSMILQATWVMTLRANVAAIACVTVRVYYQLTW